MDDAPIGSYTGRSSSFADVSGMDPVAYRAGGKYVVGRDIEPVEPGRGAIYDDPFRQGPLVEGLHEQGPRIANAAAYDATHARMGSSDVRKLRKVFFDDEGKPQKWLTKALEPYHPSVRARALEAIGTSIRGDVHNSALRWLKRNESIRRPRINADHWSSLSGAYDIAYRQVSATREGGLAVDTRSAGEVLGTIDIGTKETAGLRTKMEAVAQMEGTKKAFNDLYLLEDLEPAGPLGGANNRIDLVLPEGATVEDFFEALKQIEITPDEASQELGRHLFYLASETPLGSALQSLTNIPLGPRYAGRGPSGVVLSDIAKEQWHRLGRFIKSGVLGGVLPLLSIGYHGVNAMMAPAMIAGQLGGARAVGSFRLDAVRVMREIYAPAGQRTPNYIMFRDDFGRAYTRDWLVKTVTENQVMMSQGAAEIGAPLMAEFIKWSGRTRGGAPVGKLRDFMRRNLDPVDSTNWNTELGNAVDATWRTGVLIDSLKRGEPVDVALKLARESLFDYGRLTPLERTSIFKNVWFWTFYRESMRSMIRALINNPSRFNHQMKLAGGKELEKDQFERKEWAESRALIATVLDQSGNPTWALYSPTAPMAGSFRELADIVGMFQPLIDPQRRTALGDVLNASMDTGTALGLHAFSRVDPRLKVPIEILAKQEHSFGRRKSGYETWADARLIALIKESPHIERMVSRFVQFERIPPDETPIGTTTVDGSSWRAVDTETNRRKWYAFRQALLVVGLQRTAREWGPTLINLTSDREGEVDGPEFSIPDQGMGPGYDEALRFLQAVGFKITRDAFSSPAQLKSELNEAEKRAVGEVLK